jgi:hypothetical protein
MQSAVPICHCLILHNLNHGWHEETHDDHCDDATLDKITNFMPAVAPLCLSRGNSRTGAWDCPSIAAILCPSPFLMPSPPFPSRGLGERPTRRFSPHSPQKTSTESNRNDRIPSLGQPPTHTPPYHFKNHQPPTSQPRFSYWRAATHNVSDPLGCAERVGCAGPDGTGQRANAHSLSKGAWTALAAESATPPGIAAKLSRRSVGLNPAWRASPAGERSLIKLGPAHRGHTLANPRTRAARACPLAACACGLRETPFATQAALARRSLRGRGHSTVGGMWKRTSTIGPKGPEETIFMQAVAPLVPIRPIISSPTIEAPIRVGRSPGPGGMVHRHRRGHTSRGLPKATVPSPKPCMSLR